MKKILLIIIAFSLVFPILVQAQTKVTQNPVKILIVPGHDNDVWGAQYGNLKEADMNLVLATQIYNLLTKDRRFEVYIIRNSKGYTKEFSDYFSNKKEEIISFKENAKKEMQNKILDGSFVPIKSVPHNAASAETAIKLYGINKWANENKIDAIINVHFNDIPRKTKWDIGEYKGFVIYMPEDQMANSQGSINLAKNIFNQLVKKYTTSTLPKEGGGLVREQKLIALGSSNTLDSNVRSILIEYGYIYRFRNSTMRHKAYKTMADLTVKGIKNNFFSK